MLGLEVTSGLSQSNPPAHQGHSEQLAQDHHGQDWVQTVWGQFLVSQTLGKVALLASKGHCSSLPTAQPCCCGWRAQGVSGLELDTVLQVWFPQGRAEGRKKSH